MNYQIAQFIFQIDNDNRLIIEHEKPYALYQSDELGDICFRLYLGIPKPAENMKLIYQDDYNCIYQKNSLYYRYKGHFQMQRNDAQYQSCLVYSSDDHQHIQVYLPSECSSITESHLFNCLGLEQFLGYAQHAIIHSSYIIYRDMGIIFTAPSGTGKSTQADLWQKYVDDVEIINGDRSVLSAQNGKIIVSGIPFCGSSNISLNKSAPLQAVIVLRQGKTNVLEKLSPMKAFHYLYSECSMPLWDDEAVQGIVQILSKVVTKVPVYLYHCVKDESAVYKLLEMIEGDM